MRKVILWVMIITIITGALVGCNKEIEEVDEVTDVNGVTDVTDVEEETRKELKVLGAGYLFSEVDEDEIYYPVVDGDETTNYIWIENGEVGADYILVVSEEILDIYEGYPISIDGLTYFEVSSEKQEITEEEYNVLIENNIYYILEEVVVSKYVEITGIVSKIDGPKIVVEYFDQVVHFNITDDIAYIDEIEEGDLVKVYYNGNLPVIAIYPPQYTAVAVVKVDDGINVKLDKFDEELLSLDKQLRISVPEGFTKEELVNKYLLIKYDIVRESMPLQTTPFLIKIVE